MEFNLLDAFALDGRVMVGSVNASRDHYQMAVDDLMTAHLRWGDHLERLITNRYPHTEFLTALERHDEDEIKIVLEW